MTRNNNVILGPKDGVGLGVGELATFRLDAHDRDLELSSNTSIAESLPCDMRWHHHLANHKFVVGIDRGSNFVRGIEPDKFFELSGDKVSDAFTHLSLGIDDVVCANLRQDSP